MIEIQKNYKLTLTEVESRQLYNLLRTEKDCGGLNINSELRPLYNELKLLFDTGIR
jgi:hypothetical protein